LVVCAGFALCLAEFDSDKDGAIDARVSLPQSLRAMGLNFSDADLAAHVERIDKLKTGLVDYQDFRQYYALLWRERVARGVDEAHVRAAFHDATSTTGSTGRYRDLGSAEGGALTLDQFKHALRSLAADRLSESEIQQICRAADINHDSVIDVDEFVALLALEQPSSISLRKSILRASHASPTEYLAAFRLQPSTFRLSALCGLATRPQLSLSTLLAPRLNADGVGFFDLALDGGIATQPLKDAVDSGYHDSEDLAQQAARAVAAASSTTQSQMMNVSASTVAPIGTVLALKAAPLVTIVNNLPAHTTDASPLCLALHLQKATGVPIPRDDKARAAIKERLVRVCAFEGNTPVSNVHTCEVAWSPEAEDEWVLDGDSKDGITLQWNQFAFRTKRRVLTVVIELVALVEPDVALAPSKVVDDRATHRGQRLELCCAHTRLEFDRQQWVSVTRETEVELPLSGGASLPITAAIPILKSEILARRDSFFSRVFSPDTPPSVLSVLVRPATKLSSRFELFVQCLPLDVIVTLPGYFHSLSSTQSVVRVSSSCLSVIQLHALFASIVSCWLTAVCVCRSLCPCMHQRLARR
jgi:Ca2+-binding EF-hand superfamily protein